MPLSSAPTKNRDSSFGPIESGTDELRAIAAAKKKNDRIDADKIADCLRCDFLPECHMAVCFWENRLFPIDVSGDGPFIPNLLVPATWNTNEFPICSRGMPMICTRVFDHRGRCPESAGTRSSPV
jgi:hypothetical protein